MATTRDTFVSTQLSQAAPQELAALDLPRRSAAHSSPVDWRDEVLYFLLVDRFSDGNESLRPLLDRNNLAAHRPNAADGQAWRWDRWAQSGADRFQGGTIKGLASKLGYLANLGATAIWLSPVFKQRGHMNTYHGYGIQNFLDVDPRFGTRKDLIELVSAAHAVGIRVILDVIFNHSGHNWNYPGDVAEPAFRGFPGFYDFGAFRDRDGNPITSTLSDVEAGVWPKELQRTDHYTRAGKGDLGAGDISDPHAEHKRTDFLTLRDFALDSPGVLSNLLSCFQYWIALCDCDGFRIDTLKHVSLEEGRNFCGAIKEFAANLGKDNFFLVGEIAGGDFAQSRYLSVLEENLDAALDIGEMRPTLSAVAKGLQASGDYFRGFVPSPDNQVMGSHRNLGRHHVSILDDHDHVFGSKLRFSTDAASSHQIVAGVALQLFTLGIPCIYYGTEQAFAPPEASERKYLPDFGGSDRYLREAMFGPSNPVASGRPGVGTGLSDTSLPGFGPFGTAGAHCFDPSFGTYQRIAALCKTRAAFPALRKGRQYQRQISNFGAPFSFAGPGEIVAWSRLLSDEESLVVLNAHGTQVRGGDVIVDANLNPPGSKFTVVSNSAEAAQGNANGIAHAVGSQLVVQSGQGGAAFVQVRNLPPSELIVLTNRA